MINIAARIVNKKTVYILATLVLLIALATMVLWHFQLAPEPVAMQYNTALCFLLLSLSLLFYGRIRWASVITSCFALVITLLTLLEYIFHLQVGIDELFFTVQSFKETAYPGRMARNTAISFLLLSGSLLSVQITKSSRLWILTAFILSVAASAIGVLALIGYIFDISINYGWVNWRNISPQAAFLFALLSIGLSITYVLEPPLDLNRREIILPVLVIGIGAIFCLLCWQTLNRLNHDQLKFNLRNHGKLIASEMINNLSWHQYSVNQLLDWQNLEEKNKLIPDLDQAKQRLENMMALIAFVEYNEQSQVSEDQTLFISSKKLTNNYQNLIDSCSNQRYINYVSRVEEATTIVEQEDKFLLCMLNKTRSKLVVMDLKKVFDQITKRLLVDDTGLAVLKDNESIYQIGESASPEFVDKWKQVLPLPMDFCSCELAIWPTQDYIFKNSRWVSEVVLVFGLIITILFSIVLHYWLVSRKAHQSLQKTHLRSKKIFSENKLLYEQILDAGTDGWWDWQLDSNKEYLSPKLKRTLGYGKGDILDQPKGWQKILMPEDLRKIVENFKRHIHSKGKFPFYQEVRYRHKLGYWVWVIVRGQGIQDEDGKFRRMIGTHTDINRLKKTQADLSRSMMELNLVYNTTAYAAKTDDIDKALKYCVKLICETIGWPIGHVYAMDETQQRLVSRKIWYLNVDEDIREFVKISEMMTYPVSVGLPGMIWEKKKPLWLEQIPTYQKCERMDVVIKIKIQSAAGFPIVVRDKVIAIIEFFSFEKQTTNLSCIKTFEVIGDQLGHVFERHQHEQNLDNMAHYDSVTNIPNRRYFYEVLERKLARASRVNTKLAVLFIDFDNFKSINDNLGHDCGDQLLRKFSDILQEEVRSGDFIARFSGDEFVVLADPIVSNKDAGFLANRIHRAIKQPIRIEDHSIMITVSIGIAVYAGEAITANELVQSADKAMYNAKKRGKNNYQYFTPSLQKEYEKEFIIDQQLHGALQRDEFSLVYQPIVDIQTRKTVGLEALIRWDNPMLGRVEPVDFIDKAEETGLIMDIGSWVLRKACVDIMRLQEKHNLSLINLSVNVSPIQLQQSHQLNKIKQIIAETKIDPKQIAFEITENKLMRHLGEAGKNLDELVSLGVKIAIDDFGIGYSSFKYLKILPLSILKIDKSFIQHIGKKSTDNLIIEGIIGLASAIGLKAVAEGVETQEQFQFLCDSHCDYVQGYFMTPPLTFAELERWLTNHD